MRSLSAWVILTSSIMIGFAPLGRAASVTRKFGTGGVAKIEFGQLYEYPHGILLQPDGSWLTSGNVFNAKSAYFESGIALYDKEGVPAKGFGVDGKVIVSMGSQNFASDILRQPDGKFLIAGNVQVGEDNDFVVTRLTTNGALDTKFGNGGRQVIDIFFGSEDSVQGLSLQADGKVVVAGTTSDGTTSSIALVRLTTAGDLDTTFGNAGRVLTDLSGKSSSANHVRLLADGKILVVGMVAGKPAVFRYLSNGSLDSSYGTSGVSLLNSGAIDFPNAISLQADGSFYLSGDGYLAPSYGCLAMLITKDGAIDSKAPTFKSEFQCGEKNSLVVQGDGKVILGGPKEIPGVGGLPPKKILMAKRFLADGSADPTFAKGVPSEISLASSIYPVMMTQQSDGKTLFLGGLSSAAGTNYAVVRLLTDGSLDK